MIPMHWKIGSLDLTYQKPEAHVCAGANAAGINSVFVAGGIHAEELGVTRDSLTANGGKLEGLIQHAIHALRLPQ